MASYSVLVGSSTVIKSPAFTGADGAAADLTVGVPTVAVTRADGTVLAAPVATDATGTGYYQATLTAAVHASRLDLLTVTWTGTTSAGVQVLSQQVEVVGAFYVTTVELLTVDGLSGTSVDTLAHWRRVFEGIAERYCGVSFVPRYARETLAGTSRSCVLLEHTRPRRVVAASSTDTSGTATAFTVTNWRLLDYGELVTDGDSLTSSVYGERNLTVEYEHGLDSPPDYIVQACKDFIATKVLESSSRVGRRVISQSDESGFSQTISFPDPDNGKPTGIPDVDAALNNYGRRAPMVA